jgi:hypothetical protein
MWQIVGGAALVLVFVAGLSVYTSQTPVSTGQSGTISLTVEGLYSDTPVPITGGETVLQMLQAYDAESPELQLSTKEYAGLGTLVTGMAGKENGTDKKYWQYTVNAVMPQTGADQLELKNGDSVKWFFEESEY